MSRAWKRFKREKLIEEHIGPFIRAKLLKKPWYWDALRVTPPARSAINDNSKKYRRIEFPEDKLLADFHQRRPFYRFEMYLPYSGKRTISNRFSQKQWELMDKRGMSKEAAFRKCESIFALEMEEFENALKVNQEGQKVRLTLGNVFSVLTKKYEDDEKNFVEAVKDDRSTPPTSQFNGLQGKTFKTTTDWMDEYMRREDRPFEFAGLQPPYPKSRQNAFGFQGRAPTYYVRMTDSTTEDDATNEVMKYCAPFYANSEVPQLRNMYVENRKKIFNIKNPQVREIQPKKEPRMWQ